MEPQAARVPSMSMSTAAGFTRGSCHGCAALTPSSDAGAEPLERPAPIYSFLLEPHLDPEPVANQIGVELALRVATTRQFDGVPVAVGAVARLRERQVPTTANGVPVEEPVPA